MADEIIPKEEVAVEAPIEPVSEPTIAPEPQTAQIPVSEPLTTQTETSSEIKAEPVAETIPTETKPIEPEIQPEPIPESVKEEVKLEPKIETKFEPEQPKIIPIIISKKNLARELLVKARNAIQFRKRKKLDKVMTLFLKKQKITNDEVEKFMHVSDATATRYLNILEKENKIKQTGKTGKSVFYSKI
ncbi:MAG: hypothetical protein HXX18_14940 [Bacteroidetes bacterium]|nr:hypothetical protein [Bacteroidota bacterium]